MSKIIGCSIRCINISIGSRAHNGKDNVKLMKSGLQRCSTSINEVNRRSKSKVCFNESHESQRIGESF